MGRKKGRHPKFLPFKEARTLVHTLGIKSANEWRKLQGKESLSLPSAPNVTYKDEGWNGWEDFIGPSFKKQLSKKDILPFAEAKTIVQEMNIPSNEEWRRLVQAGGLPEGVPSRPDYYYRDSGWTGWRDFLGTKIFLSFEEARDYVRALKLNNIKEWEERMFGSQRPSFLPSWPPRQYKDQGWKGWKDFLGKYQPLPLDDARKVARSLNLPHPHAYRKLLQSDSRPYGLPWNPDLCYKNKGWQGWEDYLGNG